MDVKNKELTELAAKTLLLVDILIECKIIDNDELLKLMHEMKIKGEEK